MNERKKNIVVYLNQQRASIMYSLALLRYVRRERKFSDNAQSKTGEKESNIRYIHFFL